MSMQEQLPQMTCQEVIAFLNRCPVDDEELPMLERAQDHIADCQSCGCNCSQVDGIFRAFREGRPISQLMLVQVDAHMNDCDRCTDKHEPEFEELQQHLEGNLSTPTVTDTETRRVHILN